MTDKARAWQAGDVVTHRDFPESRGYVHHSRKRGGLIVTWRQGNHWPVVGTIESNPHMDDRLVLLHANDAYLAEPVTAPAGLADALAANVPELPAHEDDYNEGWNDCRLAALAAATALPPLTCTREWALAVAEPGDVLRGNGATGDKRWLVRLDNRWLLDNGTHWDTDLTDRDGYSRPLTDCGINWHTFIHNGAVYSIREGEAGASGLPDTGKPTCNDVAECARCLGLGWTPYGEGRRQCPDCNGTGKLPAPEQDAEQPADAPSVAELPSAEQLDRAALWEQVSRIAEAVRTLQQPADAPSAPEPIAYDKLVDAVALIQAELEMCGNEDEDWSERLRDMEKRLDYAHERLDEAESEDELAKQVRTLTENIDRALTGHEEALRTLQQDVAALKQQGGELREGELAERMYTALRDQHQGEMVLQPHWVNLPPERKQRWIDAARTALNLPQPAAPGVSI